MAEMTDEHFEVISENRARRYEMDKKELQHKVMEEYENSNNNK